jgi:hypothetical protein
VIRAGLVLLLLCGAGPALAKPGTPGPHYFAGTYERVGRSGGGVLNDRVRIEVVGQSVAIRACRGPEMLMGFGPAFEIENLMTGSAAGVAVDCLFHNNGYNRPILTCRMADGGAFTLWPLADVPVDCG